MNKPTVVLNIEHDWTNAQNMIKVDYFWQTIQEKYNIVIDSNSPDVLFIGPYRRGALPKRAKVNVFTTGEYIDENNKNDGVANIDSSKFNLSQWDYSFTYSDTTEFNYETPMCMRHGPWFNWIDNINTWAPQVYEKTKFCNFLFRNNLAETRKKFCKSLTTYKPVDCPGEVLNNMPNFGLGRGGPDIYNEKIEFLKSYKFDITFENWMGKNYLTEKIIQPYIAGCVPIYWGATNIGEYFDTKSFINCYDFEKFNEVIEYIKEVDNNDNLRLSYVNTKPVHDQSKLWGMTKEKFLERIDTIFKYYIS